MEEICDWFVNEGLPDFAGNDPIGWIATAERFFEKQKIDSSDKVQWAFMRMDGPALIWFTHWCQENFDAYWKSFSIALIRRFENGKSDGVVQEQIKEEDEIENIAQILYEKKRSQVDPGKDGDEKKEKFEAAVETPRRKDQMVLIGQLSPPKSFSSPPDLPRPPPAPPDPGHGAKVLLRRAPHFKSPCLGFPLCVDMFLTKQPPDPQERPPPEPPEASSLTTETGLFVKLFCVHIAELNVDRYEKRSSERRKTRQEVGIDPPPPPEPLDQASRSGSHVGSGGPVFANNRFSGGSRDIQRNWVHLPTNSDHRERGGGGRQNFSSRVGSVGDKTQASNPGNWRDRNVRHLSSQESGKRHVVLVSSLHSSTCAFIVVTTSQMLRKLTAVSYLFPFYFDTSTTKIQLFPIIILIADSTFHPLGFYTSQLIHSPPHHFHNFLFVSITSTYLKLHEHTNHALLLAWSQDSPLNLATIDFLMENDLQPYAYFEHEDKKGNPSCDLFLLLEYHNHEFCLLAQLDNCMLYGALFEGWAANMWGKYIGVLIWTTRKHWHGLRGQFYDHLYNQITCFYAVPCASTAKTSDGTLELIQSLEDFCAHKCTPIMWRTMLGIASIPYVAYFFLAVFYLSESPLWLISKGRFSEAKEVLSEEATWENNDIIATQIPNLSLEDKAGFHGAGSDSAPNKPNKGKAVIWRI